MKRRIAWWVVGRDEQIRRHVVALCSDAFLEAELKRRRRRARNRVTIGGTP